MQLITPAMKLQGAASMRKKYEVLALLLQGVAKGKLNGLIVNGEPGTGKTFVLERELAKFPDRRVYSTTGKATPLEIYNRLARNPEAKALHVFDDCDDAFVSKDSLNIIKGAMDTRSPRIVSWGSSSTKVECESFTFSGSIIIVTNENVANNVHYRALMDRFHSFNFTLSLPERIVKIHEVAARSSHPQAKEVAVWIEENVTLLGKERVSLRTFVKTLELASVSDAWREMVIAMREGLC